MADPVGALATDLVRLGTVKSYIGQSVQHGRNDPALLDLIHTVSSWAHAYCKRTSFLSRQYVHDGTTLRKLRGSGDDTLWLPNTPVTAISVLKPNPNSDALTEGWDQDYVFDPDTGKIELRNGDTFWNIPQGVTITYTGGYYAFGDSSADVTQFGIEFRAHDLVNSVMEQVAELWRQKRPRGGLTQVSTEGGSFNFAPNVLLPHVKRVWDQYAHREV